MTLNNELLSIIACPKCHGSLVEVEEELQCKNCMFAFPIKDDIPILLLNKARKLEGE